MLHGSFTVTRDLAASVADVWSAYADPQRRYTWYVIPGLEHRLDFREGGEEVIRGTVGPPDRGESVENLARFIHIDEERRFVFAYDVTVDGVRRWASLVSLELESIPTGTRLTHHEAYDFLAWSGDGADDVAHLRGTVPLRLNSLAALVEDEQPARRR